MTETIDTQTVGAVVWTVQQWSGAITTGLIGVCGWLLIRSVRHIDACLDGLRKDVQKHHDDTSNRLSIVEEWRRGREDAQRDFMAEYKDYRHHMLAEREIDRKAAHDLRNKVDALGYRVAILDRRAPREEPTDAG